MASMEMHAAEALLRQLQAGRSELKNIRQEIASLKHQHRKDVAALQGMLAGPPSPQPKPETKRESLSFNPIGHISTPFLHKNGTPRQGQLCPGATATLRLDVPNASHTLRGLAEFSHAWILFVFHLNEPESGRKATVAPPRLDGRRLGIFATRSPHRPNPIGLTLAKIRSVTDGSVELGGIDLVDGTPVLDIKPYVPSYDAPDCTPDQPHATVPEWLEADRLSVRFTPTASQQIAALPDSGRFISLLTSVLTNDPRSSYRRQSCSDRLYFLTLDGIHVTVWFDEDVAEVLRVRHTQIN